MPRARPAGVGTKIRACRSSRGSGRAASLREEEMDDWSSIRLCDVVNLILGGVLFFSPWMFDLSYGAQWQTASIVGIIIAVLSIAALAAFAVWEEWFILVAGIGLIVSPWLLGFQNSGAMIIDVAIGIIVTVLAGFEVWLTRQDAAQVAASD
jgi:SPW repeat